MRFYLVSVEGIERFGERWQIAPLVRLRSLMERGPGVMMPMAGEEIELRLPDGQVKTAHIASFGIEAWEDGEGNIYTKSVPAEPSLTLTITCGPEVADVPPGTEIWLPNARLAPAT
jgi:hypothetical protein